VQEVAAPGGAGGAAEERVEIDLCDDALDPAALPRAPAPAWATKVKAEKP
jgi:hypothetical protein